MFATTIAALIAALETAADDPPMGATDEVIVDHAISLLAGEELAGHHVNDHSLGWLQSDAGHALGLALLDGLAWHTL